MDKIPFSIYDFLSYLFAGFLLIVAVDYAFNFCCVIGKQLDASHVAVLVVVAYTLGQVNAHWASWLLEGKIVGWLGRPEDTLFAEVSRRPFKHYKTPLPKLLSKQIAEKYERIAGSKGGGKDLFLYCYHSVKEQCPQAYTRLQTFINLYGFSRNLSFASMLVSMILVLGVINGPRPYLWRLVILSLVVSVTLFFRYLKFYRHFSVEVYTSFLTGVKEKMANDHEQR